MKKGFAGAPTCANYEEKELAELTCFVKKMVNPNPDRGIAQMSTRSE